MAFCATGNKHSLKRHEKTGVNDGCQLLLLPRPTASRYAMLPPLLPLLDQRQ